MVAKAKPEAKPKQETKVIKATSTKDKPPSVLAMPFRSLMKYRASDQCKKALQCCS